MKGEHTLDKQVVEVFGRNRLVEALLAEGVEVAIPARDNGIDLVAYFSSAPRSGNFVAVPIQMKAASVKSFVLDKKYAEDVRISVETRGSPQVVVYATRA